VSVLAQFAVNGVVAGSVYALIALGFALIFTASRVFHFAHGGVYTLSAFAGYTVLVTLKLGIVAGFLAAIVVAAAIGVLINVSTACFQPLQNWSVSNSVFITWGSSFSTRRVRMLSCVLQTVREGCECSAGNTACRWMRTVLWDTQPSAVSLGSLWMLGQTPSISTTPNSRTHARRWQFRSGSQGK
jgi:branched-chain amino acid transport system permease protein